MQNEMGSLVRRKKEDEERDQIALGDR